MFLSIIPQFLSTYAIIKFPDPCHAALTRHWEIYSHCRSLSLMRSPFFLPSSLPPSFHLFLVSFTISEISENLSLSLSLAFSAQSPWLCNEIRIINRVIVWNTLVFIEFVPLIFDASLSGYWADYTPSLHPPTPPAHIHTLNTHKTCTQTHTHTEAKSHLFNGIISPPFPMCNLLYTLSHIQWAETYVCIRSKALRRTLVFLPRNSKSKVWNKKIGHTVCQ